MLSGVASPLSYLTLIISMITECIPCPNQPSGAMQLIPIGDLGSRVLPGGKAPIASATKPKQNKNQNKLNKITQCA